MIVSVTMMITMLMVGSSVADEHHSGKNRRGDVFSIHDTNHDGLRDKFEYQQFISHRKRRNDDSSKPHRRRSSRFEFEEIDADGDGYITEDEIIVALNRRLRKQRRYRAREGHW